MQWRVTDPHLFTFAITYREQRQDDSENNGTTKMKMNLRFWALIPLAVLSCDSRENTLSESEFKALMNTLASSWTLQNTENAVACFTENAVYMQPPDKQFYTGHEQLRLYFGALKRGTFMQFHQVWFDETTQMGAGEFTFGNSLTKTGVTGVAIVSIKNKKIAAWREYFVRGPIDFNEFISPTGKKWEWHIGNYP